MKNGFKIKTILLLSIFGLLMTGLGPNNKVVANELYPIECGNQYEVSYITDDGHFKKHACHADFKTANEEMKSLGEEYVVRHHASLSPTKIISMVAGKAYTYPFRSNSNTMGIWQDANKENFQHKTTYVSQHYELDYDYTQLYLGDSSKYAGKGMIKVKLIGFDGYTDLENTDLVPNKFIDKGLAIYLGGNDLTSQNEQPFNVILRRNYFKVEENNGIKELKFVYHQSYCKPSKTNKYDEEYSIILGPASEQMTAGLTYYSYNGYEFYNNSDYSDEPITFYPYYQFLPLRSKTNLTAQQINDAFNTIKGDIDSKLKNNAQVFIDAQNEYGVNALLLYSMAAHESGWGTSKLAMERNNLFGWGAVDGNPKQAATFESLEKGVKEHAGYNLRQYLDIFSALYFNSSLGNKGSGFNVKYASDPYWGMKISSIAYQIDKIASNNQLIDYNQYNLSLINTFDAPWKAEPSDDAKTLYTSKYSDVYQENLIVINLEEGDKYTKVQSTNPLVDGEPISTIKNKTLVPYDFDKSVAYIANDNLVPLNFESITIPPAMGEYIHEVTDFDWDENMLYVAGEAYTDQVQVDEDNQISNTLVLFNDDYSKKYNLVSTLNEDGTVAFAGSIELDSLKPGRYQFKIETTYSNREEANNEFTFGNIKLPTNKTINTNKYLFELNDGNVVLNIEEVKDVKQRKYLNLTSMNLDEECNWSIEGIAFTSNFNYDEIDKVKHELLVIDLTNEEVYKEYPLDTVEVSGFSLNDDDHIYEYIGFKGNIPFSEFANGSYRFQIRVTNTSSEEPLISLINLESGNLDFAVNNQRRKVSDEDRMFRLTTNELYSARFELKVENYSFDYTLINKPSLRDSFVSYDKLEIKDNNLLINGYGFIYYTNAGLKNNPVYNVYLVDENGIVIDLEAVQPDEQFDFTDLLSKKRDLSHISFSVNKDISTLEAGQYNIVVELSTDDQGKHYYDLFQLRDYQNSSYKQIEINNKIYQLVVSKDNYRLQLVIKEKA